MCQRIEEPMRVSGQQRKVYAALVHGLLKPTVLFFIHITILLLFFIVFIYTLICVLKIYDRVQVDESDPESENDGTFKKY